MIALGIAAAVGWVLVGLQARVVWMQRRSLDVAWERVRFFRGELETANAVMAQISRDTPEKLGIKT